MSYILGLDPQEKFDETFETVRSQIQFWRESDTGFTLRQLEIMLDTEYLRLGNDQSGRGEYQTAILEATIAAIEEQLVIWKKELNNE